jgi:C4-type Zn-finger protein
LDEAKKRKEVKEALAKANGVIEQMKQEMDALKRDRDDIIDKLVKVSEQKETLEQQVDDYGGIVKDLEDTLAASKSLIHSQKLEYEKLKHERDKALDRGLLRNTTVAIKMLRSHNLQGQSQFRQEVITAEYLNYATMLLF